MTTNNSILRDTAALCSLTAGCAEEYRALCQDCGTTVHDEQTAILSVGREFLPPCALAVLDGGEPTAEYWIWLYAQTEQAQAEHDRAVRS